MRNFVLSLLLGSAVLFSTGCILPAYSPDPQKRLQQQLYTSENLRNIQGEWERFWLLDTPNHMTPDRLHGAIM